MDIKPIIIIGGGGHAKVLIDTLLYRNEHIILGIVENNVEMIGQKVLGIEILFDEVTFLDKFKPHEVSLVNGIGSTQSLAARKTIFEKFRALGFVFSTVIHPSAYLSKDATLGEGNQVFAGSVIQAGTHIGNNNIINTHAIIEHDVTLHDHIHVSPGATCLGGVNIQSETHIGCGAILLQNIRIGARCMVAAGAVVTKTLQNSQKVAGIPARLME